MTSFVLLTLAGVLAWSAQETSYGRAVSDWEHRRLPSEQAWIHSLASLGWNEPHSQELSHRALRSLPAQLDTQGSVWVSPDWEWVAVFTDPEKTVPERVFCRECKTPPKTWNPMGAGWTGFDALLDRLAKAPKPAFLAAKVRKSYKFVDSREIHY